MMSLLTLLKTGAKEFEMLSTSYKLFLVLDQLRRVAGISAKQLQSIFDISPSTYSRISDKVYGSGIGSLNTETDLKAQRAVKVLMSGFTTKILSQTTMPQPDAISDVLLTIEQDMSDDEGVTLVDAKLSLLLSTAQYLIA